MRINNASNVISNSHTGLTPLEVPLSNVFSTTIITISDLATGTATITAKAKSSDFDEEITGGTIDLTAKRTFILENALLDSVTIEVSALASFDYQITQF